MWDDDGRHEMMDGAGWATASVVLLAVLLLVGLAIGAYLVVHATRPTSAAPPATPGPVAPPPVGGAASDDPRRVLDLRLARGEVSPEEYQAVRSVLERG